MFRQFYENSTLLDLPVLAMALFMAAYLAAIVYAWRQRTRAPEQETRLRELPLDDDLPAPAPAAAHGGSRD